MHKNTIEEIREVVNSLGRNDLEIVTDKFSHNFYTTHYYKIKCTTEGLKYEATMSYENGFLNVRTEEGSRLPFFEVSMLLALDKILERMRKSGDD